MNRQQHIQRLRAMADGWRGVRGRVSISRSDAALINELIGEPGQPDADVALIPAEEFVAAIDRIPADDGTAPAKLTKPARTKKKDDDSSDSGDEEPTEEPAGEEDTPESGDGEPDEPTPKKKSTRKR